MLFYKYSAALPLCNRPKISKAQNLQQIKLLEDFEGAENHNLPAGRQVFVDKCYSLISEVQRTVILLLVR